MNILMFFPIQPRCVVFWLISPSQSAYFSNGTIPIHRIMGNDHFAHKSYG